MPNLDVVRHRQKLDYLFKCIESFREDPELQSHWAAYLCVRVSGFIEDSLRRIFSDYVKNKSAPNVVSYASQQLERFRNPNMDAIYQLTGAFNEEWEKNLKSFANGKLEASVDSIVNVRHLVAHGRQHGITFRTISEYYQDVIKVLELIETQCNS